MEQGADHVFLVAAVAQGQGGGLQAVVVAVDGEAAVFALEQRQVGQYAVGEVAGEFGDLRDDDLEVFPGAVFHSGEGGQFHDDLLSCSCWTQDWRGRALRMPRATAMAATTSIALIR
ncbi:hypothetical protein D3C78_1142420 [compost metagenome]